MRVPARNGLASGRSTQLEKGLEALFDAQNAGGDEGATSIAAPFLRVSASV